MGVKLFYIPVNCLDAALIILADTTRDHIRKEIMYVLKYVPDKAGQGYRRR